MTNRFQAKEAVRKSIKLKIGLQGPSGSGKTFSALLLAKGMVGGDMRKVAFLDTENESALYYADRDDIGRGWLHIPFSAPYSPEAYIEAIEYAQTIGIDVLIIDSLSHEWEGQGGCIALVDEISSNGKSNNSFTAWRPITPRHNKFVDCVREARIHIIGGIRAKQDFVLDENEKGKKIPKKVGLKGIQRDGFDYEMGMVLEINMEHHASSSKDRTGLFMSRNPFVITPADGKILVDWAESAPDFYSGRDDQRIKLKSLFDQYLIIDPAIMRQLVPTFAGVDMRLIPERIEEYLLSITNAANAASTEAPVL